MNRYLRILFVLLCSSSLVAPELVAQSREEKVREDRARFENDRQWIYNDIPLGFQRAQSTGKPLLVVLRCIPCEECVKLDDELVDNDPAIRPLLEQFVCVRQVSTNGLDLSLFQFDTDQSFAVFMLNADGTIYGRFGTRSHRSDWLEDVSLAGMATALRGALDLHARFPAVKSQLAGKRGQPLEVASPELYPSLKDQFTAALDYEGNVVKSCIHCHQIGDARREWYRQRGEPIPQDILYPYPHPKSIGLILDPDQAATVKSVTADSPASLAGFQTGDQIVSMEQQPLLSIADVQWVLDRVDSHGGTAVASVLRDGKPMQVALNLSDGWRSSGDISWRASTWGLRRMAAGGMVLEPATEEQRAQLNLTSDQMALRVKQVGQYGPHAAAKQAGFRQGDILVAVGDQRANLSETDWLTYAVSNYRAGESVSVDLVRDGKKHTLQLPMQP